VERGGKEVFLRGETHLPESKKETAPALSCKGKEVASRIGLDRKRKKNTFCVETKSTTDHYNNAAEEGRRRWNIIYRGKKKSGREFYCTKK